MRITSRETGTQHYLNATAIRIGAIVFSALGSLLLFPFILKSLGEHDFGIWSIVAATSSYFLLADFGISLACTRFLSLAHRDSNAWQRIMTNALVLAAIIMLFLVSSGVLLLVGLYFFDFFTTQRLLYTVIALVSIESGIAMVLRVYQSILRANIQYIELGYFEIIRSIMRLSGLALILFFGGHLVHLVIYAGIVNILFFAASFFFVFYHYKQTFFLPRLIKRSEIKSLFDFGKFAIVVQLSELFRYRMDGIFIGLAMGLNAVTHFAILIAMIDMAVQILSRFLSYWDTITIRYVGEKKQAAALSCVIKAINIGFAVSGLFMFNFLLLGELFIYYWVGEKYQYLAKDLVLMGGVMLVITLQMAMTPYLNANGLQKKDALFTLVDTGLKLLLIFPLIDYFDFRGAILATIIPGFMVAFFLRLKLVAFVADTPYQQLLLHVLKISMVMVASISGMWLVSKGVAWVVVNEFITLLAMLLLQLFLMFVMWKLHQKKRFIFS